MQGIFQKENTDKALKYGIYRHLPTYEKIIRNLVSFLIKNYHISKKNFYRIFFAIDKMYHIKKPVLDKLEESFRAILNSS